MLADARFSTLRELLALTDLTSTLVSGSYTIFAPTNEAFAKLDPTQLAALRADPGKLKQVLLYHVVQGTPALDAATANLTTLQGTELKVDRGTAGLSFGNSGTPTLGATVDNNMVRAGNSNVYVIDSVLLPVTP